LNEKFTYYLNKIRKFSFIFIKDIFQIKKMKVIFLIIIINICIIHTIKLKTKNELNLIEHEYGNFSKFASSLFSENIGKINIFIMLKGSNNEGKYKDVENNHLTATANLLLEKKSNILSTENLRKIAKLINSNGIY